MDLRWIVIVLVFAAVFLLVEVFSYAARQDADRTSRLNRRLAVGRDSTRPDQVLEQLRRERWIGGNGRASGRLGRLVVQSGLRLNPLRVAAFLFLSSFLSFIILGLLFGFDPLALSGALGLTFGLAYVVLVFARTRRIRKFGAQLPDAIDVMVRSLRAGHPIPVSLALVAKEMPDPAGTEFGMAADEITYGSDLDTAMQNLHQRVGQEDLLFLVVSLSIQSSTGGNLAEILSNLSKVIRERFKMRRKVRSLSAEGRFSAAGLSMAPFMLFGIINLIAPSFYGEVWEHPLVFPTLLFCAVLLAVGNVIMFKMVNFKF